MDTKDIRNERAQLEETVLGLLREFEGKTGTKIWSLDYIRGDGPYNDNHRTDEPINRVKVRAVL